MIGSQHHIIVVDHPILWAEDNRYHPMPIRVKGSKQRPSPRSPVASTGEKVPDSNPDRLFLCGSPCFSVALPLHFKLEWTFAFHLHVSCRRHGQDSYKHQHNAHAHHTYSSQQLDSAQSTVPAGAVLVPLLSSGVQAGRQKNKDDGGGSPTN